MKPTWRDYSTILMAFLAVFLCGYGIGHLLGERRATAQASTVANRDPFAGWESQILDRLAARLELRAEQTPLVEAELARTAEEIRQRHDATLLDYHRQINELYGRLIELLDEEQSAVLKREKKQLEEQIEILSSSQPPP